MPNIKRKNYPTPFNNLINPGHSACAGCGEMIAMRQVVNTLGKNGIITNATGCTEVTTSRYPHSSWKVPWIHCLFENAAPVASGIVAALKQKGLSKKVRVIAQGGDGATFDIGSGLISGMYERQDDICYVCYDNEAYMNTGYQASGSTPLGAISTTSPAGKLSLGNELRKKNMLDFSLAHNVKYVATSTSAFPLDIKAKVSKALKIKGPKYLQFLTPCVPGWGIEPNTTVKVAKLAQATGLYPVVEIINGEIASVMKVLKKHPKVTEYLKLQKRFKHLFSSSQGKEIIGQLQQIANENIKKYKLSQ